MISNLNKNQLKLAEYMSKLSEFAYNASWMDNLEFSLWSGMNEEITEYGRLVFNQKIIDNLKELSINAGGWIIFDKINEETFLNWAEWNELRK